jgi:hypothetical protein
MRKYAEFFTDFCIQEPDLLNINAQQLTCAILAFTRKHLNCEVIWPTEMEFLTFSPLKNFKDIYLLIESKYGESFPEHA